MRPAPYAKNNMRNYSPPDFHCATKCAKLSSFRYAQTCKSVIQSRLAFFLIHVPFTEHLLRQSESVVRQKKNKVVACAEYDRRGSTGDTDRLIWRVTLFCCIDSTNSMSRAWRVLYCRVALTLSRAQLLLKELSWLCRRTGVPPQVLHREGL